MNNLLLVIGILCSVLLLGTFIFLQNKSPQILKVPAQWVAVATLPIILVLFAGGYISKFSGFGIVLERTLDSPISKTIQTIPGKIVSDIEGETKRSVSKLKTMPKSVKLSTRYLRFISGSSAYRAEDIKEYLSALPNLYFFEVLDQNGKFVCLLPIEYFVSEESDEPFDNNSIGEFVKALATNRVSETFPQWAITTLLLSNTDLITVLKTMRSQNINYVGIQSPNQQYLGVAVKSEIEHEIANSVVKESTGI